MAGSVRAVGDVDVKLTWSKVAMAAGSAARMKVRSA
jgi:hypothetical protein